MMTKRDFDDYQDTRLDRQDVSDGYNRYVTEYKKDQEYQFYRDHRSDPWFIERYDPSEMYKWKLI